MNVNTLPQKKYLKETRLNPQTPTGINKINREKISLGEKMHGSNEFVQTKSSETERVPNDSPPFSKPKAGNEERGPKKVSLQKMMQFNFPTPLLKKRSFLLDKRALKNSRRICGGCKRKLLSKKLDNFQIVPQMFSKVRR